MLFSGKFRRKARKVQRSPQRAKLSLSNSAPVLSQNFVTHTQYVPLAKRARFSVIEDEAHMNSDNYFFKVFTGGLTTRRRCLTLEATAIDTQGVL